MKMNAPTCCAVGCLLGITLLAGCTWDSPAPEMTSSDDSSGVPAEPPGDASGLHLGRAEPGDATPWGPSGSLVPSPLDQYGMTADQEAIVNQARSSLVRQCLVDQGLAPGGGQFEAPPVQPAELSSDPWLGVLNGEQASRYGYKEPPVDQSAALPPAQSEGPGVVSPEAMNACSRKADDRLHEGLADADQIVMALVALWDEAQALARSAQSVGEAIEAWSSCMGSQGFDYATPQHPYDEYSQGGLVAEEGVEISERELATARTDVACKAESDLVGVYRAELWESENAVLGQNVPAVDAARRYIDTTIENANSVLARK